MDDPAPPTWVRKRDGRQEEFDTDKISRALFAATEDPGKPDAFLARELADAAVGFLALDCEGRTPTTEEVKEVVARVVRELGQPALAEAFAAFSRERVRGRPTGPGAPGEVVLRFPAEAPLGEVLAGCARAYALQAVFTRDLAAAHEAGLLALEGLESPGQLAGWVLGPAQDLPAALAEAR